MQAHDTDSAHHDGLLPEMQPAREPDERQIRILFGTYADIMFILLPYVVMTIFKLWQHDVKAVLLGYDLSMAAGILGGLAVVKLILGVLIDPKMLRYKERLVFMISGTVFLILVPSLLFALLIMMSDPVPPFAMFIQPLLLILAISAYSAAVVVTNRLLDEPTRSPSSAPPQ